VNYTVFGWQWIIGRVSAWLRACFRVEGVKVKVGDGVGRVGWGEREREREVRRVLMFCLGLGVSASASTAGWSLARSNPPSSSSRSQFDGKVTSLTPT
jgi:hypothetical protein